MINKLRACPCCNNSGSYVFRNYDKTGVMAEHGMILPLAESGQCMAGGKSMEWARKMVPTYRILTGWTEEDGSVEDW